MWQDVVYRRYVGRTLYSGKALAAAKLVQDAAHGEMVLVDEEAFEQVGITRGSYSVWGV